MVEQTIGGSYSGAAAVVSGGSKSAVSWPAVIAGASVATAFTLILVALGSGLGFASLSPWADKGVSATTFAVTAAIWLIVTQWLSAGIGGYITGRLRTRWIGTHTHEVFFRDTAHGFITWSVASMVMALIVSASTGAIGPAAGAVGHGVEGVAGHALADGAYDTDVMLRPADGAAPSQAAGPDPRPEVAHLIANAAMTGSFPDSDRAYLARLVASRTGMSQQDAQKRVDEFVANVTDAEAKAKAAADTARKTAAEASTYLALSMLIGAFIASVSAALGGRLRDEHP